MEKPLNSIGTEYLPRRREQQTAQDRAKDDQAPETASVATPSAVAHPAPYVRPVAPETAFAAQLATETLVPQRTLLRVALGRYRSMTPPVENQQEPDEGPSFGP